MSTSRSSDYLAALLVGLWFLAACAFLYLWPSFKFGQPVWQVGDHQTVPPLLLSLVPLVVFGAVALTYKRPDRVSFWTMVLLNGTLYGLIFLYLFEVRSSFSRFVLPITFVLSVVVQIFGLFIFKFIRGRWIGVLVATSTIFSLTMVFVVLTNPLDILGKSFKILNGGYDALRISLRNAQSSEKTEQYLNTAFYHVRADVFQKYIPESAVRGGGMLSLDEGVLLVTGDGKFYLIRRNGGFQELDVEALVIEVPLNYEAFVNDAPITVYHKWFRVAGIHYEKTPAGIRLWVSHHYWKVEEQKFYVRLSTIEGTLAELLDGKPSSDWKTLFESTPGLTFNENSRHGNPFNGSQIGGRIQTLDEKYLLLTMGDHEWDGWNSEF